MMASDQWYDFLSKEDIIPIEKKGFMF